MIVILIAISCQPEAEPKFRIPAEWEPHEAVWLSWDDRRPSNNPVVIEIIKNLVDTVAVKVAFPSDSSRQKAFQIMDSLQLDSS